MPKITELDGELREMPQNILRDIARNESADPRYRKAAVKILHVTGCPMAKHPDLFLLLSEVKAEISAEREVRDIVETATEEPLPEPVFRARNRSDDEVDQSSNDEVEKFGPFRAGFTTKNM